MGWTICGRESFSASCELRTIRRERKLLRHAIFKTDPRWRAELNGNDTQTDMTGAAMSERNMHSAVMSQDKSGMLYRMSVNFLLNDEPGRRASLEESSIGVGNGKGAGGAKGMGKAKSLWGVAKDKERRFVCEKCGGGFGMRSNLKRHIATVHENKRVFRCELCDAAFGLKQNLCTHVRVKHMKVRPFKCEVCAQRFGYKQVLQNHRRSIHGLM